MSAEKYSTEKYSSEKYSAKKYSPGTESTGKCKSRKATCAGLDVCPPRLGGLIGLLMAHCKALPYTAAVMIYIEANTFLWII